MACTATLARFAGAAAESERKRKAGLQLEAEKARSHLKHLRAELQCSDAAGEGCGDSCDEACNVYPVREVGSPSPPADDGWDATKPGSQAGRAQIRFRLQAWEARSTSWPGLHNPLPTGGLSSNDELVMEASGASDMDAEPDTHSVDEEAEEEDSNDGLGSSNGDDEEMAGFVDWDDEEKVFITVEPYQCWPAPMDLPVPERDIHRSQLVEKLAEAAVHLKEQPACLYLAVGMLDACLSENWQRGRRMDCVQREVLGLTCFYLASNWFSPRAVRSPDKFCTAARLAEGTVKGCMVQSQVAVVENLLDISCKAAIPPSRTLWLKMQPARERSEVEYMAAFILQLADTAFGQEQFTNDVIAAAQCLSGLPEHKSQLPADYLAQIVEEFLHPNSESQVEDQLGQLEHMDLAISPTSVLFQVGPPNLGKVVSGKPCGLRNARFNHSSTKQLTCH